MELKAVIFDLDGVITDTAEYHYRAWQRLADEEGLAFDRHVNEDLRGVSRRASLLLILAHNEVTWPEEKIVAGMERKNRYYVEMLSEITPADLLPGALDLIHELSGAGVKVAIGSASKNTPTVLDRLGIRELMDAIADGNNVSVPKPAPDVFLKAGELLGVAPAFCAVVEDAEAGIDAALAAKMWAIGLGPASRVGHAHARFDSLEGVTLAALRSALQHAAWQVTEHKFDPSSQHHKETVFTSGNGNMCLRGAFEEGYPASRPACFMHRLWDDMPINFTELANLPEWWGVQLEVNGAWFGLDQGKVLAYRRSLDLRTGVLSRTVRWQPDAHGPIVDLHFERFTSLADPHVAAVKLEMAVVEGDAAIRIRTGLDAHVENTGLLHWDLVDQSVDAEHLMLHVRTRATRIELAVVAAVSFLRPDDAGLAPAAEESINLQLCDAKGQPMLERNAHLGPGDRIALHKFVAIVPSYDADDPVAVARKKALAGAMDGYTAWRAASDAEWDKLWETADVLVEGDVEAQLALRFNIFQLLIAAPRTTDRASIGAKTLSGFGYRHHVFWDTEIFMLPLFTFTEPELARHMLMYRWHNLPAAREKARRNGYDGAQFPWESAGDGREVTPTWVQHFADPTQLIRIWTGDIEIHITADIAYAVMQFWAATGDDEWMRNYGAEIVLDGASFWASAARLEADGKYHYRNVIGPDEYHDRIDDNAYTNFMARWHLQTAFDVLEWLRREHPEDARRLGETLDLNPTRLEQWHKVVEDICFPVDPETGLIEQFSGYFQCEDVDFAVLRDPQRTRSMQAILGIEGCAATQNLKQPDVLMLQYLLPERFSEEQVRINWEYYDPRTDHEHGSSLGPSISAVMACRVGHCDDGYQHFLRAARADLLDVRHNAGDGIHGASAGGLWQAVVFGFAGLKISREGWTLAPSLPPGWTRLAFKFYYRGRLEAVDVSL